MKGEFERGLHIIGEMLSYCHRKGAGEFHIDITTENRETTLMVKGSPIKRDDVDMNMLLKMLNSPRQREIEEYYWSLSGESECYSELQLVGMMTDEVSVEHNDQTLSIVLKRYT